MMAAGMRTGSPSSGAGPKGGPDVHQGAVSAARTPAATPGSRPGPPGATPAPGTTAAEDGSSVAPGKPFSNLTGPVAPLPIDDHLHRHTAVPMVTATHRNGLAEVKPYRWHRGESERGAAIKAEIEAARAAVVSRFHMAGIADDDTCQRYRRFNA